MSLIVTKKLVCDYPECDTVKSDLVWWESSVEGESPWKSTKSFGKEEHWCPNHSMDEIMVVLDGVEK